MVGVVGDMIYPAVPATGICSSECRSASHFFVAVCSIAAASIASKSTTADSTRVEQEVRSTRTSELLTLRRDSISHGKQAAVPQIPLQTFHKSFLRSTRILSTVDGEADAPDPPDIPALD